MTFRTQLLKPLARALLKITGWQLIGERYRVSKSVIVAHPHTSASDLYYTTLIALALDLHIKIVAKEELFIFGVGWLLKRIGLIPVRRGSKSDTTTLLAETLKNGEDNLHIVIAPTGTRSEDSKWHTGFLAVARKAKVPVLLAIVNREKKVCGIFSCFFTTGNQGNDLLSVFLRYHPKK